MRLLPELKLFHSRVAIPVHKNVQKIRPTRHTCRRATSPRRSAADRRRSSSRSRETSPSSTSGGRAPHCDVAPLSIALPQSPGSRSNTGSRRDRLKVSIVRVPPPVAASEGARRVESRSLGRAGLAVEPAPTSPFRDSVSGFSDSVNSCGGSAPRVPRPAIESRTVTPINSATPLRNGLSFGATTSFHQGLFPSACPATASSLFLLSVSRGGEEA